MKKIVSALLLVFLGSSAFAVNACPTTEEYSSYLRSYANKAKKIAINGGSQSQLAALKKSFENYKPKTSHACLNYFTNVQTPDCSRLKVLYSTYDSIKEPAEKQHVENQINSIMGLLEEKCPADTQAMKFFMQRAKDKRSSQAVSNF